MYLNQFHKHTNLISRDLNWIISRSSEWRQHEFRSPPALYRCIISVATVNIPRKPTHTQKWFRYTFLCIYTLTIHTTHTSYIELLIDLNISNFQTSPWHFGDSALGFPNRWHPIPVRWSVRNLRWTSIDALHIALVESQAAVRQDV